MLRITPAHSDVEGAVLKLEGRMVDEWVQLFRATCEDYLSGKDTRLILDLSALGYVNDEGVALLRHLEKRGVRFVFLSPFLKELVWPES